MIKRFVAAAMIILGLAMAAGCHTVHGMGQDIESAGESIERATDKKQSALVNKFKNRVCCMNAENATIVMLNLFKHLIKLMGYETLKHPSYV